MSPKTPAAAEGAASIREWEHHGPYNPFNSMKVLTWVEYWRPILAGRIPPPVAVSVDPTNKCNQRCVWCNAAAVLGRRRPAGCPVRSIESMSKEYLLALADFLAEWGVRSVCVGGGGEPLCNPHTGQFIRRCHERGLPVGIVTNGALIHRFEEDLSLCRWVGVSVDAATPATYARLHGTSPRIFSQVIRNMRALAERNRGRSDFEVTYKFLIHPANLRELHQAASLAKEIGVAQFHARPASAAWFERAGGKYFSADDIAELAEQVKRTYALNVGGFKTFVITHKVGDALQVQHRFRRCHAIHLTCVFEPGGRVGLCCDRRGDKLLQLCRVKHPADVLKYWGAARHKALIGRIDVQNCPRCTYGPHNEIFEQVLEKDSMMMSFI